MSRYDGHTVNCAHALRVVLGDNAIVAAALMEFHKLPQGVRARMAENADVLGAATSLAAQYKCAPLKRAPIGVPAWGVVRDAHNREGLAAFDGQCWYMQGAFGLCSIPRENVVAIWSAP